MLSHGNFIANVAGVFVLKPGTAPPPPAPCTHQLMKTPLYQRRPRFELGRGDFVPSAGPRLREDPAGRRLPPGRVDRLLQRRTHLSPPLLLSRHRTPSLANALALSLGTTQTVPELFDDIATLRPTVFPSVPRLFNRLYDKVTLFPS